MQADEMKTVTNEAAEEKKMFSNSELSEIIRIAAQEGANVAIKHISDERRKEKKQKKDRRLHNTKLLIRNYRSFKEYVNNAIFEEDETTEDALEAIEELMWEPRITSDMVVESIQRSMTRTKIIIKHIEHMIDVYSAICDKSKSDVKIRRKKVLYDMYISDIPHSKAEIADTYFIDKRTVYKDVEAACKELSVLLFGVDSIGE